MPLRPAIALPRISSASRSSKCPRCRTCSRPRRGKCRPASSPLLRRRSPRAKKFVAAPKRPRAKTQHRDLQTRTTELSEFHKAMDARATDRASDRNKISRNVIERVRQTHAELRLRRTLQIAPLVAHVQNNRVALLHNRSTAARRIAPHLFNIVIRFQPLSAPSVAPLEAAGAPAAATGAAPPRSPAHPPETAPARRNARTPSRRPTSCTPPPH